LEEGFVLFSKDFLFTNCYSFLLNFVATVVEDSKAIIINLIAIDVMPIVLINYYSFLMNLVYFALSKWDYLDYLRFCYCHLLRILVHEYSVSYYPYFPQDQRVYSLFYFSIPLTFNFLIFLSNFLVDFAWIINLSNILTFKSLQFWLAWQHQKQ